MKELTDENFEKEISNNSKPVVVDFYTDWCPSCQKIIPTLEKLEEDFKEKIFFAKVNIEKSPQTSEKFNIESIPTVVIFKNGQAEDGFLGALPENLIKEWLEKKLEGK